MLSIIQNSEVNILSGRAAENIQFSYDISVSEYIEKLLNAKTIDEVRNICSAIRYQKGFDFFVAVTRLYREGKKPLWFVMRELEDGWTVHYDENQFIFVDPSLRLAAISATPSIWARCKKKAYMINYTHLRKEYFLML